MKLPKIKGHEDEWVFFLICILVGIILGFLSAIII